MSMSQCYRKAGAVAYMACKNKRRSKQCYSTGFETQPQQVAKLQLQLLQ